MEDATVRDFLLQGAAWQDSLLQSYRSLHITFQSILLAVGIGLVIVPMSRDDFPQLTVQTIVATVLLLALWALQLRTTLQMVNIVFARGEDVNYWHRQLILAEQQFPSHLRIFTDFKIHQQARRKEVIHLKEIFLTEKQISPDQAEILVEKGLSHTRRIVDQQLFWSISAIWAILVIVSVGFFGYGVYTFLSK